MRIVEIAALPNGAHRNQAGNGTLPSGWAVVPEDLDTPNFPFGNLTAAEIGGTMTVTSWTPGTVPEPDPDPEPEAEAETSVWDELDAAYQKGVNAV